MAVVDAEMPRRTRPVALRDLRSNPKVRATIEKANEQMMALGYTEHGARHAALVAAMARSVCLSLATDPRTAELAAIAGYLHDIGNVVSRHTHPQIGGTLAFILLNEMGMDPDEIGVVIGAIGNHEEPEGVPIHPVAASVIIADKSDVHLTRVQNPAPEDFDIHDRVNHAVQKSRLAASAEERTITLELEVDTTSASIMEYFEIFVDRMVMCRKAARVLGCTFRLCINGVFV
ncbi:MAG TPA: HD domain-containing protein [Chthonomonadales bacterium]|nr:HD domain-containing protein [Chthonomonadales bacterium]